MNLLAHYPLSHEQYAELRDDIAQRGVQVPVVLNEHGQIIDGHHRVRACEELGITDYPRSVRVGLSVDDEIELAIVLNTHRRQLTREQRIDLVAQLRQRGWSMRRIAGSVGASVGTIHSDLASFTSEQWPERVETSDGRSYPANRPPRIEGHAVPPASNPRQDYVCTECGEVHEAKQCPNCAEAVSDWQPAPQAQNGSRPPLPDGPTPQELAQSDVGRRWFSVLHDVHMTLNAIRDNNGIGTLARRWSEAERRAYLIEIERVQERFSAIHQELSEMEVAR